MTSRKPPSQRDPAYTAQRTHRTLQSMAPGTMGGRVANAAPLAEKTTQTEDTSSREVVFSFSGHASMTASPPYTMSEDDQAIADDFSVTLGTGGTSATHVDLLKNGAVIGTAIVPAHTSYISVSVGEVLAGLDVLNARVTDPGAGAIDVTAVVRLT